MKTDVVQRKTAYVPGSHGLGETNGWREVLLAEITENFDGLRVPVKETDRRPGPYAYYGASGVVDYVDDYLFDGDYLLVAEDGENLRTRDTPIAFMARGKFWVNNHAHIIRANEAADTRFLMYALRCANVGAFLTGSTMPKLTQANLNRIPILLPPPAEQRAIADVLGALDDKIELNRKVCETLEAIVRAIFKSWFVDFDPVRAKAEGRDPGLPQEIANLFPDSFEDSEVGEIPRGWSLNPLGQFLRVGLGGAWGHDQAGPNASQPVYCLRGIDCHDLARRTVPVPPVRFLSVKQQADRALVGGEILVEGSGSFCGRSVMWLPEFADLFDRPVSYSNFCKRLDPICEMSQALVAWLQITSAYGADGLQGFRIGTAFPNFDVCGMLGGLTIAMPPPALAAAYMTIYRSLLRLDLLLQNRSLAAIRDGVLPKIVSGDLRISFEEGEVIA